MMRRVAAARSVESDREQARAKQHEAGCGYRKESIGYEVVMTHGAPVDTDAGPN
jgi:hypothetical protein